MNKVGIYVGLATASPHKIFQPAMESLDFAKLSNTIITKISGFLKKPEIFSALFGKKMSNSLIFTNKRGIQAVFLRCFQAKSHFPE